MGTTFIQTTTLSYVAEIDLEFLILLPSPPKCWHNRDTQPHCVHAMLNIEPKAL